MNKLISKKLVIGLVVSFLLLSTAQIYPLLTQEDNTPLVFHGIVKLNFTDVDIFEYDSDSISKKYITNSKDGFEAISNMLRDKEWVFKEQFGSGFLFELTSDEKQHMTVTSTRFSRYYILWKIPQTSY